MIRRDPKDFVLTAGGDAEYLAAVRGLYGKGKQAGTLEFKKHFYLERGPYEIVAVVDENADTEPFVLEGKFIDLFDPALPVLTRRAVLPGTQALLYNLDKVADPGRPQVLAAPPASRPSGWGGTATRSWSRGRLRRPTSCGYCCPGSRLRRT